MKELLNEVLGVVILIWPVFVIFGILVVLLVWGSFKGRKPKGVIKIKEGVSEEQLKEFREACQQSFPHLK